MHHRQESAAPIPILRTRARARHILDNYAIGPARDARVLEIWAYTERFSYFPGETVPLCVSTTGDTWDLEVGRDGAQYEKRLAVEGLPGRHHATPENCSISGCGWPVEYAFKVPEDWREGAYLVTLRARRGGEMVEEHHLFLLRRAATRAPAKHLLVCATCTWVAYNCWGGTNAYEGFAGPEKDGYSPILSTQRPWTRGFCKLPAGAPRALSQVPRKPGEMVRYPYMEWAYSYGYSKKYASAGWASYERHFARWAEAHGYDIDFATLHDLEADPALLTRHRCAVFVGHDEYWSGPMRDTVDRFVDGGGRIARFAGNFLWQIRIEDDGRRQVCYKYQAMELDPVVGTAHAALATGAWEAAPVNRPGACSFGVNGLRGIYAGLGNCVGRGSGGFTVYRPAHWAFEGAELGYGDQLGADAQIFGYEVDGVDHTFRGGLPFATGTDGAPPGLDILALGVATNVEADHQVWGETLYIGASDAAFKAKALYGEVTAETLDQCSRGNGAIVHFRRGQGEVFTAGTCEWVMGLARADKAVERITQNVLDRFASDPGS